jgi:hypothetical protein
MEMLVNACLLTATNLSIAGKVGASRVLVSAGARTGAILPVHFKLLIRVNVSLGYMSGKCTSGAEGGNVKDTHSKYTVLTRMFLP